MDIEETLNNLYLAKITESEAYQRIKTVFDKSGALPAIIDNEFQIMLYKLAKGEISVDSALGEINYIKENLR